MLNTNASVARQPTLPQQDDAATRKQRAFDLSLARTNYNYMLSYLAGVPISADLPKGEEFTPAYEIKVFEVFELLAENFKNAVMLLLKRQLESDLPTDAVQRVKETYERLKEDFSLLHPLREARELDAFLKALSELPEAIESVMRLPADLLKMATGLQQVFEEFKKDGPTAFLKSTLFDMLAQTHGRNYLQAQTLADYEALYINLPKPLMLNIEAQPWMPQDGQKPCEQDWYFGLMQTAGYNTTNLRGIVLEPSSVAPQAVVLSELQRKLPISDALLQKVVGDPTLTLADAVRMNRLYVCDYAMLEGAQPDELQGVPRYLAAPIALFYWNPQPPAGYPPRPDGVMQPVAIQLLQAHDPETAPIFTPHDSANAQDPNGLKWRVAKFIVCAVQAIQHESVAHLGETHLIIEPMAVAAHRQLGLNHPLMKLLIPHFRFTININDSALHSLIAPGGVVATNVGPAIESTLEMVRLAHEAWRWDDNHPERVFKLRGLDRLPDFAFRDDALLLWPAIHKFVAGYLRTYYRSEADLRDDSELQAWIHELTAPQFCGFKGLGGLTATGDPRAPMRIESLDYLIDMVALILYIAGPQHSAVNYAQYPMMSYMPVVAGTIYSPPPTRSTVINTREDLKPWFPPLDVGLYTFSFEYLLSGVQFDRFGHYEANPRMPYFQDERVQGGVAEFQDALALAEIEIRRRNRERPIPYPYLLPSHIPNSISI